MVYRGDVKRMLRRYPQEQQIIARAIPYLKVGGGYIAGIGIGVGIGLGIGIGIGVVVVAVMVMVIALLRTAE